MIKRLLSLVMMLLLASSCAWAAASWEWTKGEGWSEGAGNARASAREQLKAGLLLEKKGEFHAAAKEYFLCIRLFPRTKEAGISLQRLAKCLFEMENYYKSFQAIEQVIKSYPDSGSRNDLIAIEYKIGRRLRKGAKVSLLEDDPAEAERMSQLAAIEIFQTVINHDPFGELADDALIQAGDAYLALGDADKASKQYERLLREFPKSVLVDRARVGVTQAKAMKGKASSTEVSTVIKEMRTRKPDEGGLDEESAQELTENVNKLEEMEAGKMWKSAEYYKRRDSERSRKAWVFTMQELVRRYPRTSYAKEARRQLLAVGEQAPEEAKESGFTDKIWDRLPRPNITLRNPFVKEEEKPSFVTPQRGAEEVKSDIILEPVPGVEGSAPGLSMATAALPERESGPQPKTVMEEDPLQDPSKGSAIPEDLRGMAPVGTRDFEREPRTAAIDPSSAPGVFPAGRRNPVRAVPEGAPVAPRANPVVPDRRETEALADPVEAPRPRLTEPPVAPPAPRKANAGWVLDLGDEGEADPREELPVVAPATAPAGQGASALPVRPEPRADHGSSALAVPATRRRRAPAQPAAPVRKSGSSGSWSVPEDLK